MPDVVDRLGAALLDASLAATAIAGLVVLAMIQCRQPARRRGWARAGLVSTLALLPLSALNPVPRIDLRGPIRSLLPIDADDRAPAQLMGAGGAVEDDRGIGPDACPGPPGWARRLARGGVVAYGASASIGLAWVALGIWGGARVVRGARPPSTRALEVYGSLPLDRSTARPRLLVSGRAGRPVLVGLIRSTILIPPGLDEPGATDRLRLGLLHELAHAEAGDARSVAAAALARAVWFFLPPVWWIADRMKLDQEFLADRRAVGHFGSPGGYASSLVELASRGASGLDSPGPDRRPGPAGPAAASSLVHRVLMVLNCPFAIERRAPAWWRWTTALTLALATLAASCLTIRGLAGRWGPPPPSSTPSEADRSFRLPQLVIAGREHDDRPFDLRFRLPDRFTLTFEVMAEPAELPEVEVLGHRLGPPVGPDPAAGAYRLWRRVEICRLDGAEHAEVDGRPLPPGPRSARLAPWLTIRPSPGRTTRIRDLTLRW